jgi:hypothetical protein
MRVSRFMVLRTLTILPIFEQALLRLFTSIIQ